MSELPPPNWHPDPEVPGQQRYWDGTRWTEHRAPLAADPTFPARPEFDSTGSPAPAKRTNGLAVASLVIAILSFFGAFLVVGALGGVLAVVLGILAMRQVSGSAGAQTGRGIAIGGVAVGGASILIGVVMFAFFAALTTAIQEGDLGGYIECVGQAFEEGQDPAEVC